MSISPQEAPKSNWREIDARDNDQIHLLWDEVSNQFRVVVETDQFVDETPALPFEEAREEFWHPFASRRLGRLALQAA